MPSTATALPQPLARVPALYCCLWNRKPLLLRQRLFQKGVMRAVAWLVQKICPFQEADTWEMRMWGAESGGWVKDAMWWRGVNWNCHSDLLDPWDESFSQKLSLGLLPNPSGFNVKNIHTEIKSCCLLPHTPKSSTVAKIPPFFS